MSRAYKNQVGETVTEIFPNLSKTFFRIEIVKNEPLAEELLSPELVFFQKVTTIQGEELIIHVEIQNTPQSDTTDRMRVYYDLISVKYGLPIRQFVLSLKKHISKDDTQLLEERILNNYHSINICQVDPETLLEGYIADILSNDVS
ncbi:hypothetical protein [uncultured Microscilla sp.]|uniref:hypothetical protein n=1 Tax=uncultured Microscilla sp. TaxID=432653 RepID=UPI00261D7A73|nr:hypothetical protein [uncultured Microscilla sp.]